MALFSSKGGIHFSEPWLLKPGLVTVARLLAHDSGGSGQASSTTAFFTEMARRGLQDTTNWTADTYKTLLTVASGKGLVAGIIGCTAGGAETTTFEITIDGVATTIAVGTLASGERATLFCGGIVDPAVFTTAGKVTQSDVEELEADKATLNRQSAYVAPWSTMDFMSIPMLRFNQSLLIRAKHSANIVNSTATAYSAVMYRLGL